MVQKMATFHTHSDSRLEKKLDKYVCYINTWTKCIHTYTISFTVDIGNG